MITVQIPVLLPFVANCVAVEIMGLSCVQIGNLGIMLLLYVVLKPMEMASL
uniref:Uncharacterized protein n=1 Tax=Arundo donax TaxID=35708 RepID=A0A0A9B8R7_ARUDO